MAAVEGITAANNKESTPTATVPRRAAADRREKGGRVAAVEGSTATNNKENTATATATGTTGQDIKEFLENEKDVEFEEEISRNPYRLKSWWRYLLAKEGARRKTRNVIHERALKFLPNR